MDFIQGLLACLGRIMIATIFLVSAAGNKIWKFNEVAGYMAAEGVPQTPVMGIPLHKILLAGAIVFLLAGGLSVAIGYKARIGAFLLLVFLAAATYYFHDFWQAEPEQRPLELIQFLKNLSLAGTMLFIIANGAGPGSLDRRRHQRQAAGSDRNGVRQSSAASQSAATAADEPIELGDVVQEHDG